VVVLRIVGPEVRIGDLLGIDLPERGRRGIGRVPALAIYNAGAVLSAEARVAANAISVRGAG
jgi:hypothetical protein